MNYEIQFLKEKDIKKVQEFIHQEWKNDHVLYRSEELFKWQYENNNGLYDFIVTKKEDKIIGILGFISTMKYDKALAKNNIIWLALWKIKENLQVPGLGLKMLKFLQDNVEHKVIAVNGINFKHPPMYKALGYFSNQLNHFYTTHKDSRFNLLKESKNFDHPRVKSIGEPWQELDIKIINDLDESSINSNIDKLTILKTANYFKNRYLKHPFYKYRVYILKSKNREEEALISIRFDEAKGSKVLRIVDFFGNQEILRNSSSGLNQIMKQHNVEYADFWSYGIKNEIMESMGFKLVNKSGDNIVPSYFEPFVKSNISILFAYKMNYESTKKLCIFKADGDQDRPNFI